LPGLFGSDQKWCKGDYANDEAMALQFAELDALFAANDGAITDAQLAVLLHFTLDAIEEGRDRRRKRETVPSHVFFSRCSDFARAGALWTTAVRRDFVGWAGQELDARKARVKVQSFDDLLTQARRAL